MKRIKTITSHVGYGRFLAESGDILGYIPRQKEIPSPYRSSPVHCVYEWNGIPVIDIETAHKRYEIFDVTGMKIYADEDAATDVSISQGVVPV